LTDSQQLVHSQSATFSLEVDCTPPRPIWNFNSEEFFTSLGSNLGNVLYWNACMVPNECCCPCMYEVMKDGLILGLTNELTFTDRVLVSTAGSQHNYTVTVIDKANRRSYPYTCGNHKLSITSKSGFDLTVFILIGVSAIAILGTFLVWRKLIKGSPKEATYDYDDDDEEIDELPKSERKPFLYHSSDDEEPEPF